MPTIRELRESQGLSQQELATKAGLSIHTVGALEKGEPVNRSTVRLVAMALGVKPEAVTGIVVSNRVSKSSREGA